MSATRDVIACFGEALVDFLARPASEPGTPRQFVEYAGGAPANVAVAVARLGGHARFIGMLGEDLFGEMLAAQLRDAGVDTGCVRRTADAKTALAFVSLDAQGERSFSFYRPPAADLLFRAEDFDDACFDGVAVFHVCSNSLTEPAIAEATLAGMRRARAAGALVSMDLNLRPALWPHGADPAPRVWAALEQADLVKLCVSELDFLARTEGDADAPLRRLGNAHAQCVLVTDGAAPIRWFTRTRQGIAPTFTVAAIDTTAAGDAFVGGWLQSLVEQRLTRTTLGDFLEQPEHLAAALRHAAACGALATTRHGAFAAMPTRAELERAFGAAA
ncbi:MAG: carbohydrate kinase [Lysobacter sp.]|nr:carbohydrate kinase [Lysobacter sp.]